MSTIDEARPLTGNLQQRLDFETLISELSSRFIDLRPGELDREIEDGLRRICEPLGIDLAILWQWSQAVPDVIVPTHVYHVDGVRDLGADAAGSIPLGATADAGGPPGGHLFAAGIPSAGCCRPGTCRLYGIKSASHPAVVACEPPIGALGLNFLRQERDWPDALVKRLQLVAQVFTHALARQRHEQRLLQSERRLAAGAELAGLAYYEVNFEEGVAHYDERFRELCGVPASREIGLQALAFWTEQLHPDDRAHVLAQRQQLHDGRLERLSLEYRFVHPIRGERWFQHVARVSRRDASGSTLQSYGVLRDITQTNGPRRRCAISAGA